MKTATIYIFLFTIGISRLFSGTPGEKKTEIELNNLFAQAENFLKTENFSKALPLYQEIYNSDPGNSNVSYKLGVCYLKTSKEKEKAVFYLEKAATSVSSKYTEGSRKERKAPMLTYKLLGQGYHQLSQFDFAIDAYGKYKKLLISSKTRDSEVEVEINREIEKCKTGKKLMASPVNVKIENLGNKINSSFPDYSPVLTADQTTLIYTSRRPENIGGKTYDGGKYFEDIYISTKSDSGWSKASNIGPPINTVGNEAAIGISADGQEILIYKDDMGDGNIYSTSLKGSTWTTPIKLNSHINSKYWEPSAFISANGNTLYFVSDRPGGYGGRDIYKSNKTANGEWGKPVNLGSTINTEYDEHSPFLHPDGVTLFFSSTGHNTMGGFDIFESKMLNNGNWSEPINIGYPINSPGDDAFFVVSPDKKTAYYSSVREGGFGEKDNYMITFPDAKESPLKLQKGKVLDNNQATAKNVKITITDNETQEVIGVYYPNSKTGNYLFILTPGKSHNISYEADGSLFYSENMYVSKESNYGEVIKSVNLPPIAAGSKVVLNNIFFDFDKSVLQPSSNVELKRLYDFMTKNPNVAIEIAGYTDSKGTDEYNTKLSADRAKAVINYMTEKGIKKERMIAAGYGKLNPVAPNQKTDGTDDPDGRQLNRRVELKIIDVK